MNRRTLYLAFGMMLLICGAALAQHAEEPEASGNLFSGTLGDSLWTVVAFVVLLVVLSRVAWRPLLDGLNARQNHIEQQLKSAEDSRVRAENMLDEYKQQGLAVVREATEQAQQHQQQMVEKTREETLAARRRANEEIESARATAVEDLWKQTGDIVLQVSSEVLGRAMTEQDHQRLIDEAVARIRQSGGRQ
jgi:F-type H+-transporting ATPase subunit b